MYSSQGAFLPLILTRSLGIQLKIYIWITEKLLCDDIFKAILLGDLGKPRKQIWSGRKWMASHGSQIACSAKCVMLCVVTAVQTSFSILITR